MSALVLEGGVVHYEYFGRGTPLIFIHGWLGSWRYWVPAMDDLSDDHRVYAFDLWGFGDSDKSRHQYSVDCYVNLLNAFIDQLGVMLPVPLIGHALGATVAVSYALQYPQYVDRILAVSLPLEPAAINKRFLSTGGSLFDRMLGRSPTAGYEEVEQEASRTAPDAIDESVRSVMSLNLRARMRALETPMLILYGENDSVVTPSSAEEANSLGPQTRVLYMPEARHFPMLDRSSQFNRLLRDFINVEGDLNQLELKDEWQRRIR